MLRGDQDGMLRHIDGLEYTPLASRIIAEKIAVFPVVSRAYWPRCKTTAAIGTDIGQDMVNAVGTKRAFIAANFCLG
jgi:hypothetical protein